MNEKSMAKLDKPVRRQTPGSKSEADRFRNARDRLSGAWRRAVDKPGLQGGRLRTGCRSNCRSNWKPMKRLFAGAAGAALIGNRLKRRDLSFIKTTSMTTGLGALGFGLGARALTNLEARRLVGIGAGDRAVMAMIETGHASRDAAMPSPKVHS